jgi:hypothetical protein
LIVLATISSLVFDPLGYVELDVAGSTKFGDEKRRVSRIATMDGAASLNDGGYSEADRTIELRWKTDSFDFEDRVRRLLQLYSRVLVCTRIGAYIAASETYGVNTDESFLRLLPLSKVSA